MESGGKMTAEERRKWIDVLLDRAVFVHAMKNGYAPRRDYNFSQIIEASDDSIDFGEALMFHDATKYLDSLIEDKEVSE